VQRVQWCGGGGSAIQESPDVEASHAVQPPPRREAVRKRGVERGVRRVGRRETRREYKRVRGICEISVRVRKGGRGEKIRRAE